MAVLAVRTTHNNMAFGSENAHAKGFLEPADTTPTLQYIELGWVPSKIVLTNYTGTNPDIIIWQVGLASNNAIKMTGGTGVYTKGITGPYPYAGSAITGANVTQDGASVAVAAGFTIPAALQTDNDNWLWEAER